MNHSKPPTAALLLHEAIRACRCTSKEVAEAEAVGMDFNARVLLPGDADPQGFTPLGRVLAQAMEVPSGGSLQGLWQHLRERGADERSATVAQDALGHHWVKIGQKFVLHAMDASWHAIGQDLSTLPGIWAARDVEDRTVLEYALSLQAWNTADTLHYAKAPFRPERSLALLLHHRTTAISVWRPWWQWVERCAKPLSAADLNTPDASERTLTDRLVFHPDTGGLDRLVDLWCAKGARWDRPSPVYDGKTPRQVLEAWMAGDPLRPLVGPVRERLLAQWHHESLEAAMAPAEPTRATRHRL